MLRNLPKYPVCVFVELDTEMWKEVVNSQMFFGKDYFINVQPFFVRWALALQFWKFDVAGIVILQQSYFRQVWRFIA